MTSEYSEYNLIEKTAMQVFEELGYSSMDCYHESFGNNATLGRDNPSEVVLTTKLKPKLKELNPHLPSEAIDRAVENLTADRSIYNKVNANKEVYKLIRNGVRVSYKDDDGNETEDLVKVIDFQNPNNNDYFLASQFRISGELYKRRADLIGFVNGIPLIFIELKASHKKLEDAYYKNISDYKESIPQIFWYTGFIMISNGSESRVGTISSTYEYFSEWKRINDEGEKGVVSLDTIIKGLCEPSGLTDLIENFILYQETGGSLIKILSKNHQYLGVNNSIGKFQDIENSKGKLGVFWHTQGSGKSFSMIFFTQKILRKFGGHYTFVIVTDRKELDEQIYKNFVSCGAVTEVEVHAQSRAHLMQLLKENHRNVFTLIHKFGTDPGEKMEVISDRSDIIVITDEAHRSQYDTLALNMRTALPNASFIAFTGTPLIEGEEELTKETFGDYVSIYDFRQSIEDNATVPLYYENRIPELQLKDRELFNDKIQETIEQAELDPEQERKLEREFSNEYSIITRNDRLNKIAEDIVDHFLKRGYKGKGMIVCIDKPTAVRMYDKVKAVWNMEIRTLEESIKHSRDEKEKESDEARLQYMQETDMAVVVSPEQNEIAKFKQKGLDIETHRRRMVNEDLDKKFKNPEDPFRLVFVCAMWMTGFNAPPVSTIYLDKPMRNHTLMQTIARANRVFQDKPNGLIVDYIGIFKNLEKALAIYGTGGGNNRKKPILDKAELVKKLEKEIAETKSFCKKRNIDPDKIIGEEALNQIKLMDEAVDKLVESEETKNKFLAQANYVYRLFKASLPDPASNDYIKPARLIKAIADKIRSFDPSVDISEVMDDITKILDDSVEAQPYVIKESEPFDLSKIDFETLKKSFQKGKKNTQAEKLKNALKRKVAAMVELNRERMDFAEKLQEMIDEYNAGTVNVEKFFERLIEFAEQLNEEQQRNIRENLSEEELALFDILKKPALSDKEKKEVKKAAKDLLTSLKAGKLVLDWRKRQQTRANVKITIENILDNTLPRTYTPETYEQKCDRVYEHIYDSYYGDGRSVYEK